MAKNGLWLWRSRAGVPRRQGLIQKYRSVRHVVGSRRSTTFASWNCSAFPSPTAATGTSGSPDLWFSVRRLCVYIWTLEMPIVSLPSVFGSDPAIVFAQDPTEIVPLKFPPLAGYKAMQSRTFNLSVPLSRIFIVGCILLGVIEIAGRFFRIKTGDGIFGVVQLAFRVSFLLFVGLTPVKTNMSSRLKMRI